MVRKSSGQHIDFLVGGSRLRAEPAVGPVSGGASRRWGRSAVGPVGGGGGVPLPGVAGARHVDAVRVAAYGAVAALPGIGC